MWAGCEKSSSLLEITPDAQAPTEGHLGYLQIWDVCVINMHVQVFVWICLLIFQCSPTQAWSNESRLVDAVYFQHP